MKIIKYPLILTVSLIFVDSLEASQEDVPDGCIVQIKRTRSGGVVKSIYSDPTLLIKKNYKANFSKDSQDSTQQDDILENNPRGKKRAKISRESPQIEVCTQEEITIEVVSEDGSKTEVTKKRITVDESRKLSKKKAKRTVLSAWNSFDELPQSVDFHNFKKGLLKALNRLATIEKAAIPSEDALNPVQKKSVDKFRVHITALTSDHILEHIKENLVSTAESSVAREDFKRIVTELKDELVIRLNKDVANLQMQSISFEGGKYRDYSSHLEYFNATIAGLTTAIDALANS